MCLVGLSTVALSQQVGSININVPRLSPIPYAIAGANAAKISLNGNWMFNPNGDLPKGESKIEVPGEWEMQGFKVNKGVAACYKKTFDLPTDWNGKRVHIRFDAVSSNAKVYVNGKFIGEHEGSFAAFEFDITSALVAGTNHLKVMVESQTISDILACTSQYAAHPVGGILRKVTLFALPTANIADFAYSVKFDGKYKNANLNLRGAVAGLAGKAGAKLLVHLKDANGKSVSLKNNEISVLPDGRFDGSIAVSSPKKWDPEHPNLYELTYDLKVDGKVLQSNVQRIGFRQIDIRGNQLFVNNQPIKLRGANHHEVHPLRGRSLTPELCRKDVELFRKGNCNYLRTSHYPPSEEFLAACDELGMFVESESSLCWIEHGASPIWKEWNYQDEKYLPYMIRANYDNVLAGRQHPSVIIWSLGNESRWSALWNRVNEEVKKLDASRPTSFHDQCWGEFNNAGAKADVANYHYPGLNSPRLCEKTKNRPTLFGEYVHTQVYARREVATDPATKSDLYAINLKHMVDSMYHYDACLGGAIWSGIDDIFHLSADKICGYGPWGIIDGWRREKPEFVGMKNAYTPVAVANAQSVVAVNGKVRLEVQNRYDFTNFSELDIVAKVGGKDVKVKSNIKPHANGVIEIPVGKFASNDVLSLTFTDPRGFVAQELSIPFGKKGVDVPVLDRPLSMDEEAYAYLINQGDVKVRISKTSGHIVSVTSKGKDIVTRGGQMMLVPINGDDGGAPHVAGNNYTQDITPLDYSVCPKWVAKSVDVKQNSSDGVVIEVAGSYSDLEGTQTYSFNKNGSMSISYSYKLTKGYDKDSLIRQLGLHFEMPRSFDLLKWERKGLWTAYPSDDIARLKGEAKANPRDLKYVEQPLEVPAGTFANDANRLGTNDFKSTKAGIYFASLTDDSSNGIEVYGDGTQHVRSCVDGSHISFLVAHYNGDGSCYFSNGKKLSFAKGSVLSGSITILFR